MYKNLAAVNDCWNSIKLKYEYIGKNCDCTELVKDPQFIIQKDFVVYGKTNFKIIKNYLMNMKLVPKEIVSEEQYFLFRKMSRDINLNYNQNNYIIELINKTNPLIKGEKHVFNNTLTKCDFFEVARDILNKNGYSCDHPFEDFIKIISNKIIFTVNIKNSVMEVTLEDNIYRYGKYKDEKDWMINIKLIEGNPVNIYSLASQLEVLSKSIFDSKVSKYERAVEKLDKQTQRLLGPSILTSSIFNYNEARVVASIKVDPTLYKI